MQYQIPEHLSVSQLRTFMNCGLRWAFEHPTGERGVSVGWSARLRGSALDAAVTEHFRRKAENGVGITLSRMQEIADFTHREGEDSTHFDVPVFKSRERIVTQAKVYWESFGQTFTPRNIESVQMEIRYQDEGLACPIVSIVDLVTDMPMIVDTKIKGKIPREADIHRDWQLTTYAMITGVPAVALAIITDDNYPRAELIASVRSTAQINAVKIAYNMMWKAINSGITLPAAEQMRLCSDKWCPHWNNCPMGAAATMEVFSVPGLDE